MACILTGGYTIPCKGSGGIQKLWIGTYNSTNMTYTYATASGSEGQITAFGGATVSFYGFELRQETGAVTEAGAGSDANGTYFVTTTIELPIQSMTQDVSNKITLLGQGRWRIIALDENGNYWLLGRLNPVSVTTTAGGLGKAYGDLNGATITFTSKEPIHMTQVTSAAALSVIQG